MEIHLEEWAGIMLGVEKTPSLRASLGLRWSRMSSHHFLN
jgi:hypothetical protein